MAAAVMARLRIQLGCDELWEMVRPAELRSNRFFEILAEWDEALGAVENNLTLDLYS